MSLVWDNYPTRGRTQYFAGSFCQRPCGVGYGYALQTSSATGLYQQFNLPIVVITTNEVDPTRILWESAKVPPGFDSTLVLIRDTNPTTKVMEWQIECNAIDADRSIRASQDQTIPNLRLRFTTPPATNQSGDPLLACRFPWTITPMTREQVIDHQEA